MTSYLYEHATDGDLRIRTMVMHSCTKNMALVTGDADIVVLLKKHGPLTWKLIKRDKDDALTAVNRMTVTRAPNLEQQAKSNNMGVERKQLARSLLDWEMDGDAASRGYSPR